MTDHLAPSLEAALRRLQGTQIPFKAQLAARIEHLSAAFADDYDGHHLSTRSIAGLIDFLEAAPLSGYPDLTLTPAGDCYAEWQEPQGRKVAIEFRDSGNARYLQNMRQRL
jgi:hypothetical protein